VVKHGKAARDETARRVAELLRSVGVDAVFEG